MDNIFFIASKLVWSLIEPENLLIILLSLTLLLFLLKKDRLAKKLFYVSSGALLSISILPIGSWLLYPLEIQFPTNPQLPEQVDGIILLGGSFQSSSSQSWGKVQTNLFADRIHDFLILLHRYPHAKAVFTGGNASIANKHQSEAYYAEQLFLDMGIAKDRIIFENNARNTYENIIFTKKLLQPKPNENWIIISTAFHLPRTIGIFCQNNWSVIPYPADFHTNPNQLLSPSLNLSAGFKTLNYAVHEWLGLIAYYVAGKTPQLLPKTCL